MLILTLKGGVALRRELKTRTPLGVAVDNEVYKLLKEYSESTGIPMSKVIDKAVTEYLKEHEDKK